MNQVEPRQETFADWLAKMLSDKRLSVGEFHQKAKISRAGVYHYLRGERIPDQAALTRIAGALSLTVEELPTVIPKKAGRPAVR